MESLLIAKLDKHSQLTKVEVSKFIKTNTKVLIKLIPKQPIAVILEENNIQVEPMETIQSKSNMLASLLVTKDKVLIKVNTNKIAKICDNQNLDNQIVTDKILTHEYLHYLAYTNDINLVYKLTRFKRLSITEEIIINRVVDQVIKSNPSINTLYNIETK